MENVIVSIDLTQFDTGLPAMSLVSVSKDLFTAKHSNSVLYLQVVERTLLRNLETLGEFSSVDFDYTIHRGRTMQEVIDSNPYSK